jgi:hypothetical protein
MVDERKPLPPDLVEAFEQAWAEYHGWRPGDPEPAVSFHQRPVEISMVCRFVRNFSGSMPAGLVQLLAREQHAGVEAFNLEATDTYENGAWCLLALIDYRRDEYRRLEERKVTRGAAPAGGAPRRDRD